MLAFFQLMVKINWPIVFCASMSNAYGPEKTATPLT